MNKIASIIPVLILAFTLSSCKGKEEKMPSLAANVPFSSKISINYNSFSAEGTLTYHNRASAVLEISAPESVSGLVFTLEGDGISASYKGISFPLSEIGDNAQSVADVIFSAVLKSENYTNPKTTKDEFIVSGSCKNTPFEVYFDKKSGELKKISAPSISFIADFSDFKFFG